MLAREFLGAGLINTSAFLLLLEQAKFSVCSSAHSQLADSFSSER